MPCNPSRALFQYSRRAATAAVSEWSSGPKLPNPFKRGMRKVCAEYARKMGWVGASISKHLQGSARIGKDLQGIAWICKDL